MKTMLAAAAAFALSASSAFAMCAGHDVNASTDKSTTVASADTATTSAPTEAEPATDDLATGAIKEEAE